MSPVSLASLPARRCLTAATFCLYQNKIVLVKHKKLGIWLAPGGHIEPNELPHVAALRELYEETGIRGEIISAFPILPAVNSENLPLPFSLNLHWINKGNCQQHISFNYLAKPQGTSKLVRNQEETDDIGWFTEAMLKSLGTTSDIKTEIRAAFKLIN